MAAEHNPSRFSIFGNQNRKFASWPPPVPKTRQAISYPDHRKNLVIPTYSVFQGDQYNPVDPTVFPISLAAGNTDLAFRVTGNIIWFVNSTNTTDLVIGWTLKEATCTNRERLRLVRSYELASQGSRRFAASYAGISGKPAQPFL